MLLINVNGIEWVVVDGDVRVSGSRDEIMAFARQRLVLARQALNDVPDDEAHADAALELAFAVREMSHGCNIARFGVGGTFIYAGASEHRA